MKQSELKKNVDKFYLEELGKAIKREKTIKSGFDRYDEGMVSEILDRIVDAVKQSKNLKAIDNAMTSLKADVNQVKTALTQAQQGGQIGKGSVLEVVYNYIFGKPVNPQALQMALQAEAVKPSKKKRYFKEDDDISGSNVTLGTDTGKDIPDSDDENLENEDDFENDDAMDEADEILSQIDLTQISNGVRLELIEAIIDSAQNPVNIEDNDDDEFSDFMQQIADLIESFRYDGEEQEERESMEPEEEPIEGEELEIPAEIEMQEENVRGKKWVRQYDESLDEIIDFMVSPIKNTVTAIVKQGQNANEIKAEIEKIDITKLQKKLTKTGNISKTAVREAVRERFEKLPIFNTKNIKGNIARRIEDAAVESIMKKITKASNKATGIKE